MRTPAAAAATTVFSSGFPYATANSVRTLARLGALLCSLAVIACQDVALVAPRSTPSPAIVAAEREGAIVLRGTVITPEGVMKHGYVAIVNGRILSVSEKQPDVPGAIVVNTDGIILPGFVDVHNHVIWNVLERWSPSRRFSNQAEWAQSPEFTEIARRLDAIEPSNFCDMNTWGEMRALVGGTTSIMATRQHGCITGLVRNLDFNSGFYGTTQLDRERLYNVSPAEFPPASDPDGREAFAAAATAFFINNPFYDALVMHVAEGTDAVAQEQFTFLQSRGLLTSKGVLIHGVSLGASDFQAMATAGMALVWSPRSNGELYGSTADIGAALDAGVEIALAPDWALTGSSNMLDELKTASRWNREHLGGRLTDRQLVDMATLVAAHAIGVHDEVGAIAPGLRADLLVVSGDPNKAYRSVIEADAGDVQLVLIGGRAIYGSRGFMAPFWPQGDLEKIALPEGAKVLASPAAGIAVSQVEARLTAALQGQGASLAPLTESVVR